MYDVSQTEGEEIPDLDAVQPRLLDGDAPAGIWNALVTQASDAGFEVVRERRHNENGYCDFLNKQIGVRPDASPTQAVKTLVHELAHGLLHGHDVTRPLLHGHDVTRPREIQEVEVESVAYMVCDALGLDASDYSFAYVVRWSDGFVELIKDTAERVVECARGILKGLEVAMPNHDDVEKSS